MAEATFTVDADGRAKRMLENAAKAIKDFTKPLKKISRFQIKTIGQQFSSGGSKILGAKWAKRKKSYPWPILRKSKVLSKSFKQVKLTKNELHITSKTSYYKFHQLGTRKMVQRQIIGYSEEMKAKTVKELIDYINKKAQNG